MARLQKKKRPDNKKKKKTVENAASLSPAKSSTVKDSVAVAVKDKIKRSLSIGGKTPPKNSSIPGKMRKNYINTATQFLREVIIELKKVTWPSRKQTMGSTLVMIILVMIISLFLGMVDMGLSKLIQAVLQ